MYHLKVDTISNYLVRIIYFYCNYLQRQGMFTFYPTTLTFSGQISKRIQKVLKVGFYVSCSLFIFFIKYKSKSRRTLDFFIFRILNLVSLQNLTHLDYLIVTSFIFLAFWGEQECMLDRNVRQLKRMRKDSFMVEILNSKS